MMTTILDKILSDVTNTGRQSEQSQLKAILTSAFEKIDIVSRKEFDAQTAVLLRTREKINELETQLSALEKQLEQQA